jgi:hypothetical protein
VSNKVLSCKKNLLPKHGDTCQLNPLLLILAREDFTQKSGINRLNRVISLQTVHQQPQITQSEQADSITSRKMSNPTHNKQGDTNYSSRSALLQIQGSRITTPHGEQLLIRLTTEAFMLP